MATRSRIGIENKDKTITHVYCHNDGHPSYVGNILQKYHNTEDAVNKIMALGDLSSLAANLHPTETHSWDSPQPKVCVFYGRDRGEKEVKANKAKNVKSFLILSKRCFAEYVYLFKDGQWYYSDGDMNVFNPLVVG